MNDLSSIHDLYASLRRSGGTGVLATVVKTSGSTYRRPGARMLVSVDGHSAGLISGGCLETDLRERATAVIASGTPTLVTYDTASASDIIWGLGLGCTGIAHVLLEPVTGSKQCDVLDFIDRCRDLDTAGAIATVCQTSGDPGASVGAHAMLREGFWSAREIRSKPLEGELRDACTDLLLSRNSSQRLFRMKEGTVELFLEYIHAPTSFFVFGAGPDAVPLVRVAKELGWRVTVVDGRSAYLTAESFPSADKLLLAHPEETAGAVTLPCSAAAVVMTHNFNHDVAIVRALLGSPASYIGLLGPRSKSDLLLNRLAEDGFVPTDEQLARLHNPVGLDIGAETPEEIALSIIAEVQAVQRGRTGGPLRHRDGPIHR